MARPRRTTNTSFRVPNERYRELSGWADMCEWAMNSEVVAALDYWSAATPEERAAQRARTLAARETEAGRGYQHQSGKYAKAES
jgi:hypothetical protein